MDRVGRNRLGAWTISFKARKWGGQLVHGREEIPVNTRLDPDPKVELIDRLKLGDLQEELAAVGQDMG